MDLNIVGSERVSSATQVFPLEYREQWTYLNKIREYIHLESTDIIVESTMGIHLIRTLILRIDKEPDIQVWRRLGESAKCDLIQASYLQV